MLYRAYHYYTINLIVEILNWYSKRYINNSILIYRMPKIMSTGKQFLLTVPKELVELLGWSKDTEVVISKYPGKDILYIEKLTKKRKDP